MLTIRFPLLQALEIPGWIVTPEWKKWKWFHTLSLCFEKFENAKNDKVTC